MWEGNSRVCFRQSFEGDKENTTEKWNTTVEAENRRILGNMLTPNEVFDYLCLNLDEKNRWKFVFEMENWKNKFPRKLKDQRFLMNHRWSGRWRLFADSHQILFILNRNCFLREDKNTRKNLQTFSKVSEHVVMFWSHVSHEHLHHPPEVSSSLRRATCTRRPASKNIQFRTVCFPRWLECVYTTLS